MIKAIPSLPNVKTLVYAGFERIGGKQPYPQFLFLGKTDFSIQIGYRSFWVKGKAQLLLCFCITNCAHNLLQPKPTCQSKLAKRALLTSLTHLKPITPDCLDSYRPGF